MADKVLLKTLGDKIRFFRKKLGLSQLQLELELAMSQGSISRIEVGEINPTKETLSKIALGLKLNATETIYLMDIYPEKITSEYLAPVLKEISHIINSKATIAYLLDEKRRVWAISKTLQKLLKLSDSEITKYIGMNLYELLLDPTLPVLKLIDINNLEKELEVHIARLFYEMSYLEVDPYWNELFDRLKKYPMFSNILKKIKTPGYWIDIYSSESRTVKFSLNGIPIDLTYVDELIQSNPRFSIIIYSPNNFFLKLLAQIF